VCSETILFTCPKSGEYYKLQQHSRSLHTVEDQTLWWTFAGGQINHALKYGLQIYHDWKISVDNLRLKIESDRLGEQAIVRAIQEMSQADFWQRPATQDFIVNQLPEYRLSKFQRTLPQEYALEMIQNYLVDTEGAKLFLQ
jgi:ATP-dependent Lhr-like helicase